MKSIKVWPWRYAPKKHKKLSQHGGDEDWVAFVPNEYGDYWIGWAEEGTAFGCCSVDEYEVKGGAVLIGAHA